MKIRSSFPSFYHVISLLIALIPYLILGKIWIFIAFVIIVESVFLLSWSAISYEITENSLIINGALEVRNISFTDIESIRLRNSIFFLDYVDGLGVKRIGINVRKRGETFISPRDIEGFTSLLKEKIPDLTVIDERK